MEKSRSLRVDAEKKAHLAAMELSWIMHREKSFDETMVAVDMELSLARVGFAALRWNQDEVLSKLKALETDLGNP